MTCCILDKLTFRTSEADLHKLYQKATVEESESILDPGKWNFHSTMELLINHWSAKWDFHMIVEIYHSSKVDNQKQFFAENQKRKERKQAPWERKLKVQGKGSSGFFVGLLLGEMWKDKL